MRLRRIPVAARFMVLGCALAWGGCADDKSFALVSAVTTDGELTGVARLLVDVTNGPHRDFLTYPRGAPASLRLDPTTPVTFSVSFRTSHQGPLNVAVTPTDATGAALGYGTTSASIEVGEVTELTVRIVPGAMPPSRSDGGAGDAGPLPDGGGRDAAQACEPTAPTSCGAGSTCFVACRTDGTAGGLCTAGGTKQPGEICEGNQDCAPGSQCFTFDCGAQTTRTCLRFCSDHGDCGGGRCTTGVPCMGQPTSHRVCSQACDPTGTATTGCATGLHCLVLADETPDCACRLPSQTGGDGVACGDTGDCQPGFLCVRMAGTSVCRAACRLDAPSCPAGHTCTKLVEPDFETYGGCLP